MKSIVRISWSREYDNDTWWNEVCAWAIEYFGLPGNRFRTQANIDYMDFVFENHNDALMMSLRWNAKILAVE